MLPLSGALKPCLSWYQLKESCTVPLKPDTWRRYWCSSFSTLINTKRTRTQHKKSKKLCNKTGGCACVCQHLVSLCMALTGSSGREHVCACGSSLPCWCEGCSLPGCSAHVCGHCPARTLSAGHQNRPCSPSSCGQSSLSHQLAAGLQSSPHLGQKIVYESLCYQGLQVSCTLLSVPLKNTQITVVVCWNMVATKPTFDTCAMYLYVCPCDSPSVSISQ